MRSMLLCVLWILGTAVATAQEGPLGAVPPAELPDPAVMTEFSAALGSSAPVDYSSAVARPDGSLRIQATFAAHGAVARALRTAARAGGRLAELAITQYALIPRDGTRAPVVTFEGRASGGAEALAQAHALELIAGAATAVQLDAVRFERVQESPHGRLITVDVACSASRAEFDAFTRDAAGFARVDRSDLEPEDGARQRGMATLTLRVP